MHSSLKQSEVLKLFHELFLSDFKDTLFFPNHSSKQTDADFSKNAQATISFLNKLLIRENPPKHDTPEPLLSINNTQYLRFLCFSWICQVNWFNAFTFMMCVYLISDYTAYICCNIIVFKKTATHLFLSFPYTYILQEAFTHLNCRYNLLSNVDSLPRLYNQSYINQCNLLASSLPLISVSQTCRALICTQVIERFSMNPSADY